MIILKNGKNGKNDNNYLIFFIKCPTLADYFITLRFQKRNTIINYSIL